MDFEIYEKALNASEFDETIELLEENKIAYQVEETKNIGGDQMQVAFDNPGFNYFLKILPKDFEEVNRLRGEHFPVAYDDIQKDYYLLDYENEELLEIVALSEEWSIHDVIIAKSILIKRGFDPDILSKEDLKNAKNYKGEKLTTADLKRSNNRNSTPSWFLTFFLFSIFNLVALIYQWEFRLSFGSGVIQIIADFLKNIIGVSGIIDFISTAIVSIIFLICWYYTKKRKNWAYLAGIIIYAFDALVLTVSKFWFLLGFDIILLIVLIRGYLKFLKVTRESEQSEFNL